MFKKNIDKILSSLFILIISLVLSMQGTNSIVIPVAVIPTIFEPLSIQFKQPEKASNKAISRPGTFNNVSNSISLSNLENYSVDVETYPASENAVAYSESRYIKEHLIGNTIYSNSAGIQHPLRTYEVKNTPNDPSYNQWWAQSSRLPELWDTNTGSVDTVLAIIDTGVALNHEEFQGRWYANVGETGTTGLEMPSSLNCTDRSLAVSKNCNLIDDDFDGIIDNETGITTYENPSRLNCSDQFVSLNKKCNQIDDDGNGLIDDWRGWDFVNYDNSAQAGEINPNGAGTHHATYVTGVAAANANNNVGIAGVNWKTKILPLQAIDDDGYGNSISVARAVRYATDQGADVISLSLGGAYPDSLLRQAIEEAITAGVIVVAASGNDGCDCISYPANYPDVLAVGAIAENGNPASFSSYGANLDILAPGTNLYTSDWTSSNGTSAYASGIAGTSLSTPLVSALLTSLKGQEPNATTIELLAALTETTDRLTLANTISRSDSLGYGLFDTYAANSRLAVPNTHELVYEFGAVNTGIGPVQPVQSLYQCKSTNVGTTPMYLMTKGSTQFFTISQSVMYRYQQSGYSAKLFGYSCVLLPNDQFASKRILNTTAEFLNKFIK